MTKKIIAAGLGIAMLAVAPLAVAQQSIDFGTDGGDYANDGECDDPRFTGPGMTNTPLLDEDIKNDATDCRTAYEAGNLQLKTASNQARPSAQTVNGIDFGTDGGDYTNDGECDDPRFEGPGMTNTPLLDEDIRNDATDCRTAYEAGNLQLKTASPQVSSNGINFGDDDSQFANDGECDDPRFTGPGMTDTALLESDIRHDATDCKAAFDAGKLQVK